MTEKRGSKLQTQWQEEETDTSSYQAGLRESNLKQDELSRVMSTVPLERSYLLAFTKH